MYRILWFIFWIIQIGCIHAFGKDSTSFIEWKISNAINTTLPADKGLSGTINGTYDNYLLIAGGNNFPEKKLWEGGKKIYYSDIYILKKNAADSLIRIPTEIRLPHPVAYAATCNTPNGIAYMGGENAKGILNKSFLIRYKNNSVQIDTLPSLPFPLTNASAVFREGKIYIIGGRSPHKISNKFLALDIQNKDTTWHYLPDFPYEFSHGSAVVQNDGFHKNIYVIGGRAKNANGISTLYKHLLCYDFSSGKWQQKASLMHPISAHTALPMGTAYILCFGGDNNGKRFHKLETIETQIRQAKQTNNKFALTQLKEQQKILLKQHKGFNTTLLLYNTITDTWTTYDTLPYAPVTTTACYLKGEIIIPLGEIKPGERTSQILIGKTHTVSLISALDYIIIGIYFLLMIGIGIRTSRKQHSTNNYFRGGQKIPSWATGLSIFGAKLSAITFIGIPTKTYTTNWTYFILLMTIILITPFIIRYFIPHYRRLNVTSAYEYLENRFSYSLRAFSSLLFIILQLGRIGIVLLLSSLALSVAGGIDVVTSILIMGIIGTFYTVLGGIEAVIWTEVIQVIILLSGAIISVILLVYHLPNPYENIKMAYETDKLKILNTAFDFTQPTLWVVLLGGIALNITTYGTDQTLVQRYVSTKNKTETVKSLQLSAWMTLPSTLLFFSLGTLLFLFYQTHPKSVNITLESNDTIFPWYIISELPKGVSGLVISAIFAAAMGSLNGSVNSVSSALVSDFLHPLYRAKKTEFFFLRSARIITLIIGLFGMSTALYLAHTGIHSLYDHFNMILGLFTGSVAGIFIVGIFTKKANTKGTIIGFILANILQLCIYKYTHIHLLMYAFTGLTLSFLLSYLCSCFFKNSNATSHITNPK